MRQTRFAKFAWLVLVFNLVVIAWGAFVRASFSGAGCGVHWPDCGGTLLPKDAPVAMWIEFGHRASSGILLLFIIAMVVMAFRAYPKGHQVRFASSATLVFTITEALLGMWLVEKSYVAHNDSVMRVVAMSVHLTNTLLLLAAATSAVVLAERSIGDEKEQEGGKLVLKGQGPLLTSLVFGMVCLLCLGISGAISALGHQLKPVENVLQAAMSPGAHFLNRLQPLHPMIATSVGLYLFLMGGLLIHLRPSEQVKKSVQWMIGAYCSQFVLGVLNIWIQAPIWMQLVHLVAADICWIALIMTSLSALRLDAPRKDVDHVEAED